ncbi:MAG: hypothetical protein NW201_01925 [Gemmatimonadales bacterium]|nr:hypothetical protein [Gemmatimonadales bacterium]
MISRRRGAILAPVALAAGVSLGGMAAPLAAQQAYPAWFLETPRLEGVALAVGYAPVYRTADSARAEAERDGTATLALHAGLRVKAGTIFEVIPGGQGLFRGERYEEAPLGAPPAVRRLASAQVGNMTLVLVATREVGPPFDGARPMSIEAPPWVGQPPVEPGALVAVGVAPRYFYEKNCWGEAERHGRQQLAFAVASRTRELSKGTRDEDFAVLHVEADVLLRTVEVRARWADASACHALVRATGGAPR